MRDAGDPSLLPASRRLLRCSACGQLQELSTADLLGYMRNGWPKCCGQVMTYHMEADRPPAPPTGPADSATI